jgi:hypothetical protein
MLQPAEQSAPQILESAPAAQTAKARVRLKCYERRLPNTDQPGNPIRLIDRRHRSIT